MPGAILRYPQFTHFIVFDSLKYKSFKLWNPASKGKEVNIRKYILEKVQDILLAICYLFHNSDQVSVC